MTKEEAEAVEILGRTAYEKIGGCTAPKAQGW